MEFDEDLAQQITVQLQQILSAVSTTAVGQRYLIPRAKYVTGPAFSTIPTNTKAFNVINLGLDGLGKTFADIQVSGIAGITEIMAAIRVFGYTIENDNDVLRGLVTVTPAAGHIVLLQYMIGQNQINQ
jgi:hypothetical protein